MGCCDSGTMSEAGGDDAKAHGCSHQKLWPVACLNINNIVTNNARREDVKCLNVFGSTMS